MTKPEHISLSLERENPNASPFAPHIVIKKAIFFSKCSIFMKYHEISKYYLKDRRGQPTQVGGEVPDFHTTLENP